METESTLTTFNKTKLFYSAACDFIKGNLDIIMDLVSELIDSDMQKRRSFGPEDSDKENISS